MKKVTHRIKENISKSRTYLIKNLDLEYIKIYNSIKKKSTSIKNLLGEKNLNANFSKEDIAPKNGP